MTGGKLGIIAFGRGIGVRVVTTVDLLWVPMGCVCACPPVMSGDTVKHALTSTSSPPNDVPSIPWSPVVLPLWTPWGAC
jgi:hypothetical protein